MSVAVGDQRRNKEAQEFLVLEIAKGDEDGIPNLLRTAIERGWYTTIPGFLVEAKKKKETEIDRICSRHYTDFLGSVNELLKMKGSVKELKALVSEINGKFSSTGGDLVESLNDLSNIQNEREHAKRLLESAIACKDLSSLLAEVKISLERDQHYQAMRLLQTIQAEQSNPLIRPLSRHLQTWLPIAKNKLLYAARSEADIFIESLRDKMALIGGTLLVRQSRASLQYYHTSVMNATLNEGGFEGNYMRREMSLSQSAREYANPMSIASRASIALGYILLNANSFRVNLHIGKMFYPEQFIPTHFALPYNKEGAELVDYKLGEIAPLHKALHIYHELGIVSNFHDHYRHDRRELFNKLLKTFEKNANSLGLMRAVAKYFEDLTGFFAIECIMGNMIEHNNEVFAKQELNTLWLEAMTKLRDVTLLLGITMSSPQELLQLKEEMLLLMHMMADEIIGMDMSVLLAVMWTLFDNFDALSVQYLTQQIKDALDHSAFQRYVVTNPEVFQLQVKHFKLDVIDVNQDTPHNMHKARPLLFSSTNATNNNINNNGNNNINMSANSNTGANTSNDMVVMNPSTVDAQLDALEQEMGLLSSGNATNNLNNNTLSNTNTMNKNNNNNYGNIYSAMDMGYNQNSMNNGNMNNSAGNSMSSANFIPQTYPFSAFVPVILTELQFALIRLFLFVMVPAPESWTRQRRQQDKLARLIAAQGGNGSANSTINSNDTSTNNNANNKRSISPVNNNANNNTNSNNTAGATSTSTTTTSVGNIMLHLATAGNVHITDFLCRNLLGLFALLCDQWILCLQKDGLETALSKACQIAIDATFITLSVDFYFTLLETNLEIIFGADAYDPTLLAQTQDVVVQRLRRVTSQAQDLIFELLANKIDALLESLQFIDYAPEQPPFTVSNSNNSNTTSGATASFFVNLGASNTAWIHDSIESLVDFLTITFMCFTHLPQAVREAVHFTSCAKLAQGILEFLLSPEKVPKLNVYAYVALDADVKRLMLFADTCGISDLRRCFDELHETVKAVLHPDLLLLGEDVHFRMKTFPHLNADKLADLLDKTLPSPVSATTSNLPRLEKQMVKATAKRLRQQQQLLLKGDLVSHPHSSNNRHSVSNNNSNDVQRNNTNNNTNNKNNNNNNKNNNNNNNNATIANNTHMVNSSGSNVAMMAATAGNGNYHVNNNVLRRASSGVAGNRRSVTNAATQPN